MSERYLTSAVLLAASGCGARLFRNNTGVGWVGKLVRVSKPQPVMVGPGDVVLRNARPLHAGLHKGSGDLIGWTRSGRFLSMELKTETVALSPEQRNWIEVVNRSGGLAAEIRDAKEVLDLLGEI